MLIDILEEKGGRRFIHELLTDPRTASLCVLLMIGLVFTAAIIPYQDTNGMSVSIERTTPLISKILCAVFTWPGECLFSTSSCLSTDTLFRTVAFPTAELAALCFLGVLFWIVLLSVSSIKNIKYLVLPYLMFSVFAAIVYSYGHHIGVTLIFLIFWFETAFRDERVFQTGKMLAGKAVALKPYRMLLKRALVVVSLLCLTVPLYWSVRSGVNDVLYAYDYVRSVAAFIKENGLEGKKLLAGWDRRGAQFSNSEGHDDYIDTNHLVSAISVNAYFEKNIFFNLNHGKADQPYIIWRCPNYEESQADLTEWRSFGKPEVIIGKPELQYLYDDIYDYDGYRLVALIEYNQIWKNNLHSQHIPVFVVDELADELNLSDIG